MKKFEIQPGNEIRGFKVRLYTDQYTETQLLLLEKDCRYVWNFLWKLIEDTIQANHAYIIKNGLIETKPSRPNYEGLTPEQSKEAKEAYIEACKSWHTKAFNITKNIPCCEFRKFKDILNHFGDKYDYQFFARVSSWQYNPYDVRGIEPCSYLFQALSKNFFTKIPGQKRKKRRKATDSMPLQVRSKICFKLGEFGSRRNNPNFYNCQISFNSLKIKGRLPGKIPEGRLLEGVSLIREADGWWASIKFEAPIKKLPDPIANSVVGIDVGLDNLVAMSDRESFNCIVKNERGKDYAKRIAARQAANLPTGRLQLAAKRNNLHNIHNEVMKSIDKFAIIKVEKLNSKIGQMGSSKVSSMRLIKNMLTQKFGERVREVECSYTSQDCSQCGFRSKESWSYNHGPNGKCPSCGLELDRDLNAARNIAAKEPISLIS